MDENSGSFEPMMLRALQNDLKPIIGRVMRLNIAKAIRSHGAVENERHWSLDVSTAPSGAQLSDIPRRFYD